MKKVILTTLMILGLMALFPARTFAAELGHDPICDTGLDETASAAAGCTDVNEAPVGEIVQNIINVVIAVLGLVAVVFVIVGAVQYMTSQGDPGKTKKARDTILYAILGVVLAGLAYTIVNFVLKAMFSGGTGAE